MVNYWRSTVTWRIEITSPNAIQHFGCQHALSRCKYNTTMGHNGITPLKRRYRKLPIREGIGHSCGKTNLKHP